jgi:hypothetical protein
LALGLEEVLWSYDTKIEVFGHAHQQSKEKCICRKYLIPTVKNGCGSLMLWGYFTSTHPGALVKVNGIMNQVSEHFS